MRHLFKLSLVSLLILGAIFQPLVKAEENRVIDDSSTDPNTMVITTSRFESNTVDLPSHVTLITQDEIARIAATNLSQVLRRVPGLQVSYTNGKTSVSMRGISAEQASSNVLVLVDGQRLNKTDLASPDLDTINIIDIERIEIIQGAASSLYGDQAVAGVINIITKSGNRQSNIIRYSQGRFDSRQAAANLAFELDEQWSLILKGDKKTSDNYREHNELDNNQLGAELHYQDSQQQWRFSYRSRNETQQTPGALLETDLADRRQSRPEFAKDYVSTDESFSRLFGQLELNSNWQFAIDLNHQEADIDSVNSFINFATTNVNQTHRTQSSIYPRVQGQWQLGQGVVRWISGIDYDESEYAFSLLARSNQQTMESLYSQLYWPLSKQTTLEIAGRLAEVEDDLIDAALYPDGVVLKNSATAYDLGLSHEFSHVLDGYIRYSNNYRFAKVDEQAYTSETVLGLEPQKGRSIEAGITSQFETSSLQASVYQLKLEDEIFFDPSATPPAGAFFPGANVNGAESTRLGLMLDYRLLIEEDELGVTYHWVDANSEPADDTVPGVSKNTITTWYDWQVAQDVSWYLEAHYRGERYQEGDTSNSLAKVDGYTLWNSALYWRLDNARIGLRVDNLLDKEYIDYAQFNGYYPAKGRDFVVTFDLVF
ncbi:TonB-dependent receptor [Kangiella koreensis]|uniref:TonB-dependent receptor plug n=1 Tax=Kangiella koreensis (strain DSM 16069 / JCM 12317 / KCTC 12182 / SW-125) TaxID=523791 RepID=C7RCM4_KANKD|nr:TonB-dependent receptor [Kangiella koreensis]ACV27016.1 TonB-dependent receptor plug [Kangiella koreensis DSM 16069]